MIKDKSQEYFVVWKWYKIQIWISISKVLLVHGQLISLEIGYGHFHATNNRVEYDRDFMVTKTEISTAWALS